MVGEAGSGHEGFEMAKKLKPDLVVVDISLPDQSGIQLTRDLRELLSETKILIVSMHSKIDYIAEAFQAGATGYVVKESASERLLQGLKSVANGDYYLDSSVSHAVVENLMKSPLKAAKITDADYATLTPREQEVMRFLAEGLSSKEVAEKLFISPKTVENHRANIMNKLGPSQHHRVGSICRKAWPDRRGSLEGKSECTKFTLFPRNIRDNFPTNRDFPLSK